MSPTPDVEPGERVYSIGYERRTPGELVALLADRGVDRLIDVRELPVSRRKGFSKTALAAALGERGIEYVHLRAAGNPFRSHAGDAAQVLALYARHLDAHPEVLGSLEAAIAGHHAALLCLERDVACCHRGVLIDRLLRRKPCLAVTHL